MRPALALAVLLAATPALAAAPEPTKPVSAAQFSGRYYEIARLPTPYQRDCEAPTMDWESGRGGGLAIVLTCHHGSPSGRTSVRRASARIIDAKTNAKLKVSFMGGIASAEYRVLDYGPQWVLIGTSGGNYLWVLSRTPKPAAAVREAAIARAKALGYNVSRFIYPKHAGAT